MRVKFIYMIVPQYRVPLFEGLINQPDWDVTVQSCPKVKGMPKTTVEPSKVYDLDHDVKLLAKEKLRWMTGIMSLKDLKKGDVLVLWGDPRFINALPLMLMCKMKGIKTMWWGQGYTAYSAHRVGLRQKLMKFADSVMLYTDREVERYRANGYNHPMMFAKNNALDQDPIQEARKNTPEEAIQAVKDKFNLTPGKTLVTVGRLIPKMQLDIAIKAMATPELQEHHLIIVGDGEMKEEYQKAAQEHNVQDRIHYTGAIYNDAEMAPYLLASDIFIYPGAIGLSIFHALGFGLPVVTHSTEENQMPEWTALEPGKNGAVFEENSVDDFKRAILSLDTVNNRDFYRQNALDTVLNNWNMDNTIKRFKEAVEKLHAS